MGQESPADQAHPRPSICLLLSYKGPGVVLCQIRDGSYSRTSAIFVVEHRYSKLEVSPSYAELPLSSIRSLLSLITTVDNDEFV